MQSNVIPTDKAVRERPAGTYVINEVFYSIQGEGVLAGTPMMFVRFADCNLRCNVVNAGFDCDTEFMSGRPMLLNELAQAIAEAARDYEDMPEWLLLTGGEPALQLDDNFLNYFDVWRIAIETNGTIALPTNSVGEIHDRIRHVCVSPKSAEHTLRQRTAHEVKYVRRSGQAIPEPTIRAKYKLISPAAEPDGTITRDNLEWCIKLVKENPTWRLSVQQHKLWNVR